MPPRPEISRRNVLCGLGAAALVPAALAACSAGTTSAPTQSTTSAPGAVLTSLAAVPVGGGTVVNGPNGPVVVVQPVAGQVRAFSAVCPHQGSTVRAPVQGVITCPNHGSQFDAASGDLRRGPATRGLTPVPVRVQGGQVKLA